MSHIFFINGPNLNLLGTREPHIYGSTTLSDIEQALRSSAGQSHTITFKQSQHEGQLIEWVHQAPADQVDVIVINAAGLTHTSVALRDSLLGIKLPFIELHLSNIHQREPFRHHSFLADIANGIIMGFGPKGYQLALEAALCLTDST